jgi:ABC-type phosphate transport system substrate-binding protein
MRVEFSEDQPRIDISVVSSGSGRLLRRSRPARAMLAPMSRAMRASEIEEVEKRRKGKVDFIDSALDAIAVSVYFRNR